MGEYVPAKLFVGDSEKSLEVLKELNATEMHDMKYFNDFGEKVDMTVILLRMRVLAPIQDACREKGVFVPSLKPAQRKIMGILGYDKTYSIKDLALYADLSYSNISKAMNHLVDNGYIERYLDKKHKGVIMVRTTEYGKKLLAESDMESNKIAMEYISSQLSKENQDKAKMLMGELCEILNKIKPQEYFKGEKTQNE